MESLPPQKRSYFNVVLLGCASLLNDVSSDMIFPILPLLIAKLGGTGVAIGLIGGLRESFADLLKAFFGYWSDRIGKRKVFVYAGYGTTTLFKLLLFFAQTWTQILVFVGLERVGKGLRTAPRDALITQSVPGRVGTGFGIHRAFDTLGGMLGSIVAFYAVWKWKIDFSTIILWAFFVALFSVIPLFWVIEEPEERPVVPERNITQQPQAGRILFSPQFVVFMGIATLFSLANISYMFCMLHASGLFSDGRAVYIPMLLYVLFNSTYTMSAIPFGMLSDVFGRWHLIVAGYALFAMTMLSFAIVTSFVGFMFCFALYGVSLAIIKVTNKAYVADLSLPSARSTALGAFEAVTGIATLLAGVIAGLIWEYVGHTMMFMYAGLIAVGSLILMTLSKYMLNNKSLSE